MFSAEINPTLATKKALRCAQALLGTCEAEIRIFYDQAKRDLGEVVEPLVPGCGV